MSRAPKRTPRERLVAYYHEGVGCGEPRCGACKRFAKLLRAHERDLFNRAVRGLAALHPTSKAALVGIVPSAEYEAVRLAILGTKRGRRA